MHWTRAGLVVALLVVSGSLTADAETTRRSTVTRRTAPSPEPVPAPSPASSSFTRTWQPVVAQGRVGTMAFAPGESASPRRRGDRGTAAPLPLPVPEMPVPPGLGLPSAAAGSPAPAAYDVPLAPPSLALSFPALGDNNGGIPPDTHGAVGPDKVMTMLNTEVRVHDRTGGELSTVTLGTFWQGVATASVFDPRVHFDPDPAYGGRWIWVAVQGAKSPSSGLLVGASTGTQPSLGWGHLVDADGLDQVWADYPSVGFNRHWVVVQVNMFNVSDNAFNRTHIYVFDKADLYSGTVAGANLFYSSVDGGTQVPALTYEFDLDELYLLQRWNAGAGALKLYRVVGPVGTETLEDLGFVVSGSWADTGGPADFAPQLQTCTGCVFPCERKIQTNDSRIQKVVYRGDSLWATQTVFLPAGTPERASVQWWEIATDTTVRQQGLVDDPTGLRFYAFPSLAVNRHGDMLLGYSSFEGTEYAGGHYSFRHPYDSPGTLQGDELLKAGEACYFKDFATGRNRWGDYSAAVVDPLDDTALWTIQEYASVPSGGYDRWGTWWGMLDPERTLSIADASVSEGASGTTALTFTITLSAPTTQTVTVEWSTQDGTATTADSDYLAVAATTVTFNPGEDTRMVTVDVVGDLTQEPDETLQVNIANPTNAALGDAVAQGTILNDDGTSPQMSIGDVVLLEGDGDDSATSFVFTVTLSNPSASTVSATWSTTDGTATGGTYLSGADYAPASGSVVFSPGETSQPVAVAVHGDTTLETDEQFFVDLSSPTNAALLKSRGTGTILDDDATNPDVEALAVIADSVAGVGRNRVQWINPTPSPTTIRIRWKEKTGSACVWPTDYPTGSADVSSTAAPDQVPLGPGLTQMWEHSGLTLGTWYCYRVWALYGATPSSGGPEAMGRPYDSSGSVKWKYFTGATSVVPPTVGLDGVLAVSNDFRVHAMARTASGGTWPAAWAPTGLGAVVHQRSPIVPLGGQSYFYVTTEDGRVHSIDARTGSLVWSTQLTRADGSTPAAAQAAPAGIFAEFGGPWSYLLVGTREAGNNLFYALDPYTGAVVDWFPKPADGTFDVGAVSGTASVDYATASVFFASRGTVLTTETLWCLQLGPPTDALQLKWNRDVDDVDGSPTLRWGGDRVYVGNNQGVVWAVDKTDGVLAYSYATSDGAVNGFIFPDRRNTRIYFSTLGSSPPSGSVWGLNDTGTSLVTIWNAPYRVWGIDNVSPVLHVPTTGYVYVGTSSAGGSGGGLYRVRVDLADPNSLIDARILETTTVTIGAPSLDGPNNLIHVGSEAGTLYAVTPIP